MAKIATSVELAKIISNLVNSEPKTEDNRYRMFIETIAEAAGAYYSLAIGNILPPEPGLNNWSIAFHATADTSKDGAPLADIDTDVTVDSWLAESKEYDDMPETEQIPLVATVINNPKQDLPEIIDKTIKFEGGHLWISSTRWYIHQDLQHMMTGTTDLDLAKTLMLEAGGAVIDARNKNAYDEPRTAMLARRITAEFYEPDCDRKSWLQVFAALYRRAGALTYNIADAE